jgi:hypothetical protein
MYEGKEKPFTNPSGTPNNFDQKGQEDLSPEQLTTLQ